MPVRPNFFCGFEPRSRHDIQRLLKGFKTEEQAKAYRRKRIAILRQGGAEDRRLAEKLEACGGPDGCCLSPADPACARHHRR